MGRLRTERGENGLRLGGARQGLADLRQMVADENVRLEAAGKTPLSLPEGLTEAIFKRKFQNCKPRQAAAGRGGGRAGGSGGGDGAGGGEAVALDGEAGENCLPQELHSISITCTSQTNQVFAVTMWVRLAASRQTCLLYGTHQLAAHVVAGMSRTS